MRRHRLPPGVCFAFVFHLWLFFFGLLSSKPSFLPILLLLSPVSCRASPVGVLLVRTFKSRLDVEIAAPAHCTGIFRLVRYADAWFSALITEAMQLCACSHFHQIICFKCVYFFYILISFIATDCIIFVYLISFGEWSEVGSKCLFPYWKTKLTGHRQNFIFLFFITLLKVKHSHLVRGSARGTSQSELEMRPCLNLPP